MRQLLQLLKQLPPGRVRRYEPLHPEGVDLPGVDEALRIHGDHVQAEKLAPGFAYASQLAHDLAGLPVEEPDLVVHAVGDVKKSLLGVGRLRSATSGAGASTNSCRNSPARVVT